jgi:UDP-N-acetylmuramate--alanine ligase
MDKLFVHFIGIGGSGLSAIARVLIEKGYRVSGSDRQFTPLMKELQSAGAQIFINHNAENIRGASLVIRSSAIPDSNIEVQTAIALGIPVLKRFEYMERLLEGNEVIAIAGTHGKTTTTAMIAWILSDAGFDPSFIIGGMARNLKTNAHAGQNSHFVIEADEYDRMFLGLEPKIAIVTNIEYDHPDCYPTPEEFYQAFYQFSNRIKDGGYLVICSDNPGCQRLIKDNQNAIDVIRYGLNDSQEETVTDYLAKNINLDVSGGYRFDVYQKKHIRATISLKVPGMHNILNALASFAVADLLQIPVEKTIHALSLFDGTSRRFEIRGEVGGVIMIDDYAHHPSEVKATITAAKTSYPNRHLWVVWQPHTFSRLKALWQDFTQAFSDADQLIVSDVFPAREMKPDGFSMNKLVQTIKHDQARYIAENNQIVNFLETNLKPNDVLLVLSAGNANEIIAALLSKVDQGLIEEGRS